MQFQITFHVSTPGQLLPLSYQYELSSWIYALIGKSNQEFASFLHSEGYGKGVKRFKLFTFSHLNIPRPFEILDDRIKILSREISLVASFLVPQAADQVITGLFQEQRLTLGDRISQVELEVQEVRVLPLPDWGGNTIHLQTTSPLMVSKPEVLSNGKLRHQYLSPLNEVFEQYFEINLKEKHRVAVSYGLAEPVEEELPITFHCLSEKPKKRLIRIRAHTPSETKVAGYLCRFKLSAPRELIRVGMLAGFGGENALGFGAVQMTT